MVDPDGEPRVSDLLADWEQEPVPRGGCWLYVLVTSILVAVLASGFWLTAWVLG